MKKLLFVFAAFMSFIFVGKGQITSGSKIFLQTRTGYYVNCTSGTGNISAYNGHSDNPDISDEIFTIQNINGSSSISSGDKIYLITRTGYYVNCTSGTGNISAYNGHSDNPDVSDEIFTIEKINGGGNIRSEDKIYIKTRTGYYFNCTSGTGNISAYNGHSDNPDVSDEIFTIREIRNSIRIPRSTWTGSLNSIFQSSAVRLNNFTPNQNQYRTNERQFYKPDDSYIRLRFNGTDYPLPIFIDIAEVGPNNMCKMYINDWNTHSISVAPDAGKIKITLQFEDAGREIESNCYNNFNCFVGCPKFDYTNAKIDIWLTLVAQGGRLSYEANPIFSADANESGPCVNNLFAFLCPSDRAGMVKSIIETRMREQLNSVSIRIPFDIALGQLVPAGVTVNAVEVNRNGDIVIR